MRKPSSSALVFASFEGLDLVREQGGRYSVRRGAEVLREVSAMEAGALIEDPSLMVDGVDSALMVEAVEAAFGRFDSWSQARGFEAL